MNANGELKCHKTKRVNKVKIKVSTDEEQALTENREDECSEKSSGDEADRLSQSWLSLLSRKPSGSRRPNYMDSSSLRHDRLTNSCDLRKSGVFWGPSESSRTSSAKPSGPRRSKLEKSLSMLISLDDHSRISSLRRSINEYFPQRRQSSRIIESKIKEEKHQKLVNLVNAGLEVDFEIRSLNDKGRAVFTKRCFEKNEYVLEYSGDLLNLKEAKRRECEYSKDKTLGCYMFYFRYLCKSYCIDATSESGRLGRLINHSRYKFNLITKVISINGRPRLLLIANRRIEIGEELLYDYGDRSKASLREHPWLAT
ncbi:hypothetical protein ACOME3_006876 [Neoechinorhynchus agilis]